MMSQSKCCLIQDLLPLYIENLVSENSEIEINQHIQGCEACHRVLTNMQEEKSVDLIMEADHLEDNGKVIVQKIKKDQDYLKFTFIIFSMVVAVSMMLLSTGIFGTIPMVLIVPCVLSLFFDEDKVIVLTAIITQLIVSIAIQDLGYGIFLMPLTILSVASGLVLGKWIRGQSKHECKKIGRTLLSFLLVGVSLFGYNFFFGHPVGYLKAKSEIYTYIMDNYDHRLAIEGLSFNYKMNAYVASIVHTDDYRYRSTISYSRYGNIIDNYHDETEWNMITEIEMSLMTMIEQLATFDEHDLEVYVNLELPEFKYGLTDKYSGIEPFDVDIWLHPSKEGSIEELDGELVNSYESQEAFAKDVYQVIKVLKQMNYPFETIAINSYLSDGNTSYKILLTQLESIHDLSDVEDNVFIQESLK